MRAESLAARLGVVALFVVPALLALLAPVIAHTRLAAWLDGQFIDSCFKVRGLRATSGQLTILAVDDATYGKLGLDKFHWGWYHAEVIRRLAQGGAKAIAVDLYAPPLPSDLPLGTGQELTLKELEQESFLAMGEAIAEATFLHDCPVFLACLVADGELLLPRSELLDATGGGHDHLGFVNLPVGEAADSVVREFDAVLPESGETGRGFPSLPYLIAYYARTGELVLAAESAGGTAPAHINYAGPPGSFGTISYRDILLSSAERLDELADRFRGRVVLLGDWGQPTEMFVTPFADRPGSRSMSGVEVLANAADTFYLGNGLRDLSALLLVLVAAVLLAISTLVVSVTTPLSSLVADIVLAACTGLVGYSAFANTYVVPAGTLVLLLVASSLISRAIKLLAVERERRLIAGYFRRSMGPSALRDIPSRTLRQLLKGERFNVAVLAVGIGGADGSVMQGGTGSVVALMRKARAAVAALARDSDGWLYRYVGGTAVVFFGCPIERPDPADAALSCGRLMIAAFEEFDEDGGCAVLPLSLGLHYGAVVIGSTGDRGVIDFFAAGPVVEGAKMLATLCGEYEQQILASGEFERELSAARPEKTRELGECKLPGQAASRLITFVEKKRA